VQLEPGGCSPWPSWLSATRTICELEAASGVNTLALHPLVDTGCESGGLVEVGEPLPVNPYCTARAITSSA
jgi:hypothetical protein